MDTKGGDVGSSCQDVAVHPVGRAPVFGWVGDFGSGSLLKDKCVCGRVRDLWLTSLPLLRLGLVVENDPPLGRGGGKDSHTGGHTGLVGERTSGGEGGKERFVPLFTDTRSFYGGLEGPVLKTPCH